MGTFTITPTYTKVDIRKTFENFEADLRMIVSRTGTWTEDYMENVCHDIYLFAEYSMLRTVDITLKDEDEKDEAKKIVRAAKFTVNANGSVTAGGRPGGNNDWPRLPNGKLNVVVTNMTKYDDMSEEERAAFRKDVGFKSPWGPIKIDLTYQHLRKENGQLYGSSGYELKKDDYKK